MDLLLNHPKKLKSRLKAVNFFKLLKKNRLFPLVLGKPWL